MEDWSKNFFKVMGTAMLEVESFFDEMAEEISEVFDEWGKFSEEIAEEISTNVTIEFYPDLTPDTQEEDMDYYFIDHIEPTSEEYPACRGCIHYHGQVYGGNLLVCGMHPYGVEDESCPDWESNNSSLN
ncbi:MAG: hypothetical protein O4859_24340 [Trichodesmium sp. St18_bin1]|jgi:hypothetical protein|nr:hypothetical protein [Trichodesmium sp. St18_bin1]MDE5122114.1 hypothetical protein [Trichodesmium sp. St19_bin1]